MSTDFIICDKKLKCLNVNSGQYNSINLNQNRKHVQMKRSNSLKDKKTVIREKWEADFELNCKTHSNFNHSSFAKKLEHNFETTNPKSGNEPWSRRGKKNIQNSSTLALHIAAYENSIEPANAKNDEKDKQVSHKKSDNLLVLDENFTVRNPFEFLRQQKNKTSGIY